MQVCHGKAAPLRRIKPEDRVIYYSPTLEFRGREKFQMFTAIGIVKPGEPYSFDMGGGFRPFRRDVAWLPAREVSILPLLAVLELTAGVGNWGYPFRFGLLAINDHDLQIIAGAMGAEFTEKSD